MPTVYRIECEKCGIGPYNCRCDADFFDWMLVYREGGPETPGMLMDAHKAIINNWEKYHCGFSSMDQLHSWFTGALLQALSDQGFKLVSYEVDYVYISVSGKQVFFIRDNASDPTFLPITLKWLE